MAVTESRCINSSLSIANRQVRYEATFRVLCENRREGILGVLAGAQLASPDPVPAYFATYNLDSETDVNAFAQEFEHKRDSDENTSIHYFTVRWFPIEGNADDDSTSQDDPLAKPVEVWGGWEEIQIPLEAAWNETALPGISRAVDTYGPIQDAAGQEPSTPIMKTKRIPVLFFKKNYATLAEIIVLGLKFDDHLNGDTFYGIPEGKALYRGVDISRPLYAGGTLYYEAIHAIAIRDEGWSYSMVNRGWKFLNADGDLERATVKDKDGEDVPVADPINLELDGTKTPDRQKGTIIDWRTSPKRNFTGNGGLGL